MIQWFTIVYEPALTTRRTRVIIPLSNPYAILLVSNFNVSLSPIHWINLLQEIVNPIPFHSFPWLFYDVIYPYTTSTWSIPSYIPYPFPQNPLMILCFRRSWTLSNLFHGSYIILHTSCTFWTSWWLNPRHFRKQKPRIYTGWWFGCHFFFPIYWE